MQLQFLNFGISFLHNFLLACISIIMRFRRSHITFIFSVVNLVFSRAKRFTPPGENENREQEERDKSIPWHSSLDAVVKCVPGERHQRFPSCLCGQYAKKVAAEELMEKDEEEMKLLHFNLKGRGKEYYECIWCTMCPDGVIMTDRCRQSHDTQCHEDFKCQDPDYVFDDRIKACRQRENVTPAIGLSNADTVTDNQNSTTEEPVTRSQAIQQNGEGLSTQPDWFHIAVIAAIAVGIFVGVEVLVLLVYFACKRDGCSRSIHKASSSTSLESSMTTECSCISKKQVETSV